MISSPGHHMRTKEATRRFGSRKVHQDDVGSGGGEASFHEKSPAPTADLDDWEMPVNGIKEADATIPEEEVWAYTGSSRTKRVHGITEDEDFDAWTLTHKRLFLIIP